MGFEKMEHAIRVYPFLHGYTRSIEKINFNLYLCINIAGKYAKGVNEDKGRRCYIGYLRICVNIDVSGNQKKTRQIRL